MDTIRHTVDTFGHVTDNFGHTSDTEMYIQLEIQRLNGACMLLRFGKNGSIMRKSRRITESHWTIKARNREFNSNRTRSQINAQNYMLQMQILINQNTKKHRKLRSHGGDFDNKNFDIYIILTRFDIL